MDDEELEDFYIGYILPQFEVVLENVRWEKEARLNYGDTFGFWFSSNQRKYILLWEDYQSSQPDAKYIQSLTGLESNQYKIIEPRDKEYPASIRTPYWKYEEKFVGWFTLLELV